ncbi:hypothetical protein CHARACLAT_002710 [Characodon lateralis]|uniref:Uncharacterized protein n=1 Tax=Characodon lateralis TaxID=208331 RepID=A0ABU7F069_9TELE|nr:hypothetical protein [Characodon lateralis]
MEAEATVRPKARDFQSGKPPRADEAVQKRCAVESYEREGLCHAAAGAKEQQVFGPIRRSGDVNDQIGRTITGCCPGHKVATPRSRNRAVSSWRTKARRQDRREANIVLTSCL